MYGVVQPDPESCDAQLRPRRLARARVRIRAWGAGGGGGQYEFGNHGGGGGFAEASFAVCAGDTLLVTVGAGGRANQQQHCSAPQGGAPNGGSGSAWRSTLACARARVLPPKR